MRRAVEQPSAQPELFAAPVRGWVEDVNLALADPTAALVLDNWFPLNETIRLRGGAAKVATVGSDPVLSFIPFVSGQTSRLFAATDAAVFDISGFDPDTAPTAEFSGMTSGRWSWLQTSTAAGEFILAFNGADDGRLYTGASDTWAAINAASSPAITGVATADVTHVWSYASRVWMVEGGTQSAWYLPAVNIAGAATEFFLGAVFREGGNLLFGFSWSADSGDGPTDRCVFVSETGEVVVYQGSDPESLASWGIVGRYSLGGAPIGTSVIRTGGDVLIATEAGLVPMSSVVSRTPEELSLAALSRPIWRSWQRAASTRVSGKPFMLARWNLEGMGLVGVPHRSETFVINLRTNAWARFTGWDVQALGVYGNAFYFADAAGSVFRGESGGADDGLPYTGRAQWMPSHMGQPGQTKVFTTARGTFRHLTDFVAKLSSETDYGRDFPTAPSAALIDASSEAIWDVGSWDVMKWDVSSLSEYRKTKRTRWRSINRSGVSFSPQVQVTSGSLLRPDVELIALEALTVTGRLDG